MIHRIREIVVILYSFMNVSSVISNQFTITTRKSEYGK